MKSTLIALFAIWATCCLDSCHAGTTIDVLGCKLNVPSGFMMRFDTGGNLKLEGPAQDGIVSVLRYADINWGDSIKMPKSKFGTYLSLDTRTTFITTKNIKVFQITDRRNVVMFFGGASNNWKDYLHDCHVGTNDKKWGANIK
ncbi:MAG: hypothetical protein ACYC9L_12390 [Sulfuricaulis sp.]